MLKCEIWNVTCKYVLCFLLMSNAIQPEKDQLRCPPRYRGVTCTKLLSIWLLINLEELSCQPTSKDGSTLYRSNGENWGTAPKSIHIKMEELIPVLSSDFHIHTMMHMLTHRHTAINIFKRMGSIKLYQLHMHAVTHAPTYMMHMQEQWKF